MPPREELTHREREVRDLALRGLSNRSIARELFIEESTVKSHMTRVLTKSGVRSRAALIATAVEPDRGDRQGSAPAQPNRLGPHPGLVIGAVAAALLIGATALLIPPSVRGEHRSTATASLRADPFELSGAGFFQSEVDVPKGALSLSVRLICEETQWYMFAGDLQEAHRVGGCGGASEFRVPVGTTSPMTLSIFVSEESTFVAHLTFEESAVVSDPELADNCEALSMFRSEVLQAELAYGDGLADEAQWHEETRAAVVAFEKVIPEPLLDEQFAAILAWTKSGSPGTLGIEDESLAASTAWSFAGQICEANASSLFVYGGARGG